MRFERSPPVSSTEMATIKCRCAHMMCRGDESTTMARLYELTVIRWHERASMREAKVNGKLHVRYIVRRIKIDEAIAVDAVFVVCVRKSDAHIHCWHFVKLISLFLLERADTRTTIWLEPGWQITIRDKQTIEQFTLIWYAQTQSRLWLLYATYMFSSASLVLSPLFSLTYPHADKT